MAQKNFRFSLGRKAIECPNCGRRVFKPYIDTLSGEILSPDCGRCNREHKCGYHLRPSELFSRNPNSRPPRVADIPQPPREPPSFIDDRYSRQRQYLLHESNLYCFLTRQIQSPYVESAFLLYGTTHSKFCDNASCFWLRDRLGRLRSAKVMAYDAETGKRLKIEGKQTISFAHSLLRLENFNYEPCFFGEHLAARYPKAKLLVVESEKTALILAAYLLGRAKWGEMVALASGGASGLNVDCNRMTDPNYRCSILVGRDVELLPDADMVEKWAAYADRLKFYCRSVKCIDTRLPPWNLMASEDVGDKILANPYNAPPKKTEEELWDNPDKPIILPETLLNWLNKPFNQ